jgi:hypothetical protein
MVPITTTLDRLSSHFTRSLELSAASQAMDDVPAERSQNSEASQPPYEETSGVPTERPHGSEEAPASYHTSPPHSLTLPQALEALDLPIVYDPSLSTLCLMTQAARQLIFQDNPALDDLRPNPENFVKLSDAFYSTYRNAIWGSDGSDELHIQ